MVEFSLLVIAISFVVLNIIIIFVLYGLYKSMTKMNQSMIDMRAQMNDLSAEAKKVIDNANQITTEIKGKIKTADGFFNSVAEVGEAVHQVTSSVKQASATLSQALNTNVTQGVRNNQQTISEYVEVASLGVKLFQKVRTLLPNKKGE